MSGLIVPQKMYGVITAETEQGWAANMGSPMQVQGVELPLDSLCLTRGYAGEHARTRITNLHCPEVEVGIGMPVAALVKVITKEQPTGRMVRNWNYRSWDRYSGDEFVEEMERVSVGSFATRWGIKL